MCDLETHQAVDLMPERSTESFQAWLEAHPDVEIISRDRGDCYIKGATLGAPNATQVADRWHLLRNLSEATERVVSRHHRAIKLAIKDFAKAVPSVETDPGPETEQPAPASGRAKRLVEQKAERRDRRLERYNTVVDLHSRGIAIREIARRTGLNRNTVKRFVQAGQFPERAHTQRKSQIDPFIEYLHQRWSEGCRNAAQLTQELIKRGYRGSSATVRRCVAGWRKPAPTETAPKRTAPSPTRPPSTRRLAWILVSPGGKVSADDLRLRHAICQQVPRLKVASRLGRWFTRLVCGRREPTFDAWLKHARHSDLKTFAEGLLADEAAVRTALTLPWSNGQVEGHINRLKLLKRQMYGRASFDLLRRRFLYAG
jgi:transposase